MTEAQNEPLKLKKFPQIKRVFSTESTTSSSKYSSYLKTTNSHEFSYKCYRLGLLFKLLQLATEITNAGLYSGYLSIMSQGYDKNGTLNYDLGWKTQDLTNLIFPNVVFSTFIIVVGVILISYLLGQIISEVIERIFNTLALILHFISVCITLNVWFSTSKTSGNASACDMLLAQVFTTFLSTLLYFFDLFLSLKRALKHEVIEGY